MTGPSVPAGSPQKGEYVGLVKTVWTSLTDDQMYGAEAPRTVDPTLVLDEWLTYVEGLTTADLTDDEKALLVKALHFMPLHSVVKADEHWLDPDDCGGWHTEASGKRTRPAWWIDFYILRGVIDAVIERADHA